MMNVYERKVTNIILTDSFIYELCKEEWHKIKLTFDKAEARHYFVKYLCTHFYELICKESPDCVWSLMFEFYKNIDFYEITDYVIDFF